MRQISTLVLAALLLAPTMALAHTRVGAVHGFAHGFGHPLGGVDHILAMVTVGILAAQLGGRTLWLVPATFVLMMAAGGAAGTTGLMIPFVELGIVLSVIVLGVVVALKMQAPVTVAMGVVGFFAIFHGYAHGAEMPHDAGGLAYGLGFVAATAMLHAVGIGIGLSTSGLGARVGTVAIRVSGCLIAAAGVGLLANIV